LSAFLDDFPTPDLVLSGDIAQRHARVLNIVDPASPSATAICFTAQYGKCLKSGGSLVRHAEGLLRRFSPHEILRLLGFSDSFRLPPDVSLRRAWHLTCNSADIRCLRHIWEAIAP
jgi:hypothetical protein